MFLHSIKTLINNKSRMNTYTKKLSVELSKLPTNTRKIQCFENLQNFTYQVNVNVRFTQ